jgi:cholesterol oxidase
MKRCYDVVIIGSGFGGAITGCRLAQAGRSVCILERGKRWGKRDFPRTIGQVAQAFWGPGRYGLLDYRAFKRMDVLQASGVGGGSLVYSNVIMRAPTNVFQRGWPKGVCRETLEPYYDQVREMLEATPLPAAVNGQLPTRTAAFLKAVRATGRTPEQVDIAVYTGPDRLHPVSGVPQSGCVWCGNCNLGCHIHAKNTLDLNYLALAEKHGAEVYPLHQADKIEPLEPGGAKGYRVGFRTYDPNEPGKWAPGSVVGRTVLLAAGALGSTELLLRCRDQHRTLPRLGRALGERFSGNGDFALSGTFGMNQSVDPTHGACITAGVTWSTPEHTIYIEDYGLPDPVIWFLAGALPSSRGLTSILVFLKDYLLRRLGWYGAGQREMSLEDLIRGGAATRFVTYLAMGQDAADGRLRLSADRLDLEWDHRRSRHLFRDMEKALKELSRAMGGRYRPSPLWSWPLRKLLTAHPLGGCPMADSRGEGVVNCHGAVWDYPNLYVADGAIVPTALGVNPCMTISALAERIAEHLVRS